MTSRASVQNLVLWCLSMNSVRTCRHTHTHTHTQSPFIGRSRGGSFNKSGSFKSQQQGSPGLTATRYMGVQCTHVAHRAVCSCQTMEKQYEMLVCSVMTLWSLQSPTSIDVS